MANGSGIEIDGGSVRWKATTVKDKIEEYETRPHPPAGRMTRGADDDHGDYLQIVLRVPEDGTAAFNAQFTGAAGKKPGETVVLYMRIEDKNRLVEIHWTPGLQPPPATGSRP
jgi:hypothetical protein